MLHVSTCDVCMQYLSMVYLMNIHVCVYVNVWWMCNTACADALAKKITLIYKGSEKCRYKL